MKKSSSGTNTWNGKSSEMKHVVCTVTNDLSFDQRMIRICNALCSFGYDVTLVGRKMPHSLPLLDQCYRQKRLNCFFTKGKFFYAEYNLRLFFFLIGNRWNIVHSVDLDTLLPAFLCAKLKRKHIVYDAHEIFTEVPELLDRPITRSFWNMLESVLLPQIKFSCTVGNELALHFNKKYGIIMQTIRNVPMRSALAYEAPKSPPFFLYQGALNKGRGIESMILAMHEVDAELWIAGEGDLSVELRKLTHYEGLDHKVKFLGYVLPKQLQELTTMAWAGFNVSEHLGLSYFLSLNNKCFDYIQAGIPAVTNPFPEYLSLNNQFETMIFANAEPASIAGACLRLLTEPDFRERLAANARKAAEVLCWEEELIKLKHLYDRIA